MNSHKHLPMIIRANHDSENRFFLCRRATAQDKRLTSKARGVLAFLLSKHDGWTATVENLKNEFPDLGRDAAYNVINELISFGYAKRTQERDRQTGVLGKLRVDVYEMPLTDFQETATPLTGLPDTAEPDTAQPLTANQEHINKQSVVRDKKAEETEQQQQTDAAAAASAFSFDEIKLYVLATKAHSTNAGGLAKYLERTGEEDSLIREWIDAQRHRKSENLNQTPFDTWTQRKSEQAAQERERRWLESLPTITRNRMFEEAAEEFAKRFSQHAKGNWKEIHKSAIEKLIITNYYEEEIAA